ncbi:MAG TPA: helix-hairpin-helix domain-containing protein [Polyangiales bacterium]|nr:helix-hairpin-helix domain-containing protein [Polyangiales bacterium]
MHGSAAHAALGLVVAALALAALATQRGGPDDAPPPRSVPVDHAASGAVRALRDGQRLDLNRASAEELTLVPGIGPKLAQRIVEERARRGAFTALEQLRAVRGLGPKTLQRIAGFFAPLTARRDTKTSRPP